MRIKIIVVMLIVFSCSSLEANSRKYDELMSSGIALHDKEKYEEAIEIYKSALNEDGSKALVNYEIAYSYIKLKNYSQAEKYLRECIKLDENNIKAFSQLGWIYYNQSKFNLSSKMYLYSYLKSVEQRRKDIVPLSNIYFNLKKNKDRYDFAKRLVFTFPNEIVFLNNLSLIGTRPSKEEYLQIGAVNKAEMRENLINNISGNKSIPKSEKSIFMALAYKILGDNHNYIKNVDLSLTSKDEVIKQYAELIKKGSYELRPYYSEDAFIEYVLELIK